MSRYKALALTWRPKSFDQVVGQKQIVTSLSNAISMQKIPQCLLFTGTRGVGKTTIARILAKCLNCLSGPTATPCQTCEHCTEINAGRFPDLYEVDAASRTKVEDTRELLDNIPYSPSKGRYKVYLIDEVHMLSTHSFNALLKTLEEPPEHVIFLLATTDPQKLPATVLSRCLQFKLQAMTPDQIDQHIQYILTEEGLEFDTDATAMIAHNADGSMRDALSLLDQAIAHGNGSVKTDALHELFGTIDTAPLCQLLSSISQKESLAVFDQVNALKALGIDFQLALKELAALLQQVAVTQVVGKTLAASTAIQQLAESIPASTVQHYYNVALKGIENAPFSPTALMGFEMTLIQMLADATVVTQPSPQVTSVQPAYTAPAAAQRTQIQTQAHASAPKQRTAAAMPAQPPASAPVSEAQPVSSNDPWKQLLPKLGLRGLSLVLAQHCELTEKTENLYTFSIDIKQLPLKQKRTCDAMSEALTKHFNRPVRVTINTRNIEAKPATTTQPTSSSTSTKQPASTSQPIQSADNNTDSADNPFHQDPEVQRIMHTFSGTIDEKRVAKHNH